MSGNPKNDEQNKKAPDGNGKVPVGSWIQQKDNEGCPFWWVFSPSLDAQLNT